jgi:hypothetical protein
MIVATNLIGAKLIFCLQFIGFDKIAPVAIFLTAAGIEIA